MPTPFPTNCFFCNADIMATNKRSKHNFCNLDCFQAYRKSLPVQDAMEKWLSMVDKTPGLGPTGECWEWTGKFKNRGYGSFVFPKGESTAAHIASYRLHTGDLYTKGFDICHSCDNKKCVNPAHLFKGTRKDNLHDMITKGRKPIAEDHANSKLSNEQVIQIRERATQGESVPDLAAEFGLNLGSTYRLIRGERYASVPGRGVLPARTLTDEQVKDLRRRRKVGVPAKELAEEFGLGDRAIRRIITGERYGHIPLE